MTINVALAGLGYWGPNMARTISTLKNARLYALCEANADRLEQFGSLYSMAKLTTDYNTLLQDNDVHAIVLATPVHTHFELARAALKASKHVLVEKPLAQSSKECCELIGLAEGGGLTLMAGHIFMYNQAVRKVKEYIDSGLLGKIYYVYAQRLNFGIIRKDVNALWNFAPHDFSIINYWLGALPTSVVASGYSYIQPDIEDVVFITLNYPSGVGASVHISWLDPHKVRRITLVGSEKMVVYDDVSAEARVVIYDKGVTKKHESAAKTNKASLGRFESYGEYQLLLRAGDVVIPKLDFVEPLKVECQHFIDCIQCGEKPLTDGHEGLRVVAILEAAQRSLEQNGRMQHIKSKLNHAGMRERKLTAEAQRTRRGHRDRLVASAVNTGYQSQ
jgi:predicted dehydrogenase